MVGCLQPSAHDGVVGPDAGPPLTDTIKPGVPLKIPGMDATSGRGEDAAPSAQSSDAGATGYPMSATERRLLGAMTAALPLPLPADKTNKFADDPRAAALGKKLFNETAFSGPLLDADHDGGPSSLGLPGDTGKVACASCHIAESGFSDTRSFQLQVSLGAGWGRRRAPSLLDVGHSSVLMWDGRRDTLYNQVFGPFESVVEMNSSRLYVAEQVYRLYKSDYETLFGPLPALNDAKQFPALTAELTGCQPKSPRDPQPTCDGTFHGGPGDRAEYDGLTAANQEAVTRVVVNVGKAIGAFERQLSCGSAPFDAWLGGNESAVSDGAKRGALLFVGKGGCSSCHTGPRFTDEKFHNVGVKPELVQQAFVDEGDRGAGAGLAEALADPLNSRGRFSDGDDGRLPKAVGPAMEGAFRTPSLRCVSKRPAFLHTGQIRSLVSAVEFFNGGGAQSGYPGVDEIAPLGLTDAEVDDLTAFLESLDGAVIQP
jgi:cytochrome c peroxidase